MESKSMPFIFLLTLFYLARIDSDPLVPAIYVFGDSLSDTGNNNFLPTLAKPNYLPYGSNFAGGPTGRFTNGRTIGDFAAEFLGLPYPPPVMDIHADESLTGLNYASGSCGILHVTGLQYGKCLSFEDQLNMFEYLVEKELSTRLESKEKLIHYLETSLVLFYYGSNDIYNTASFNGNFPTRQFVQLLTNDLSQGLQRLYKIGMRKFVVPEVGPVGCVPALTRTFGHCLDATNKLTLQYNDLLAHLLTNLQATLQGSTFVLAKIYSLALDAIKNRPKYGLIDGSNPCCVALLNGAGMLCIPGIAPCADAGKHFFWDGLHLTETIYSMMTAGCISNSAICSPTIKELVQL